VNSDEAKQVLLGMKAEIEARLARTHKHIHEKEEPVSPRFDEQIKQTEDDQLVYALDQEGQQELGQIKLALLRIEAGQYATCSSCGADIGKSRLQAIPYTELCIKCATQGVS
jgi:DnaK suppressor protein